MSVCDRIINTDLLYSNYGRFAVVGFAKGEILKAYFLPGFGNIGLKEMPLGIDTLKNSRVEIVNDLMWCPSNGKDYDLLSVSTNIGMLILYLKYIGKSNEIADIKQITDQPTNAMLWSKYDNTLTYTCKSITTSKEIRLYDRHIEVNEIKI